MDSHLSSAALIDDGRVIGAVREEALVGQKGYAGFPHGAISYCLSLAEGRSIDSVAFALQSDPFDTQFFQDGGSTLVRRLASCLSPLIPGRMIRSSAFGQQWVNLRRGSREQVALEHLKEHPSLVQCPVHFVNHHRSHAIAAAMLSPHSKQESQLVFVADGYGDGRSGAVFVEDAKGLKCVQSIAFCDSLGSLYSRATAHLGMKPWEHEHKVMGLAPYGKGPLGDALLAKLRRLFVLENGRIINREQLVDRALQNRLGRLFQGFRFDQVAYGVQSLVEELLSEWIAHHVREQGIARVSLVGGLFLNVKANQRIAHLPEVSSLFIFPPAGDDGSSVGAALQVWSESIGWSAAREQVQTLSHVYWGPDIEDDIVKALALARSSEVEIHQPKDMARHVARALAGGEIVGHCVGRAEFGPRALGNRSILCAAGNEALSRRLNSTIKGRDFWMPFAAVVQEEYVQRYLKLCDVVDPRYMIVTFPTTQAGSKALAGAMHPADESTRPQVVSSHSHQKLHAILEAYGKKTGEGCLLNTSFNLHGEAMAMTALLAVECFLRSNLKVMVLGSFWLEKPALTS